MKLSITVAVVGDERTLARCLTALAPQADRVGAEVIVPYDDALPLAEPLMERFPGVRFLQLGTIPTRAKPGSMGALHELFDRRIAAALNVSTGDIVAIVQDWGVPAPDWCEQVLAAHRLPHAAIGGCVVNRGQSRLNWAVYFLDFGRYQPPLSEGPAQYLTDVNVSYKREALESVRRLWSARYCEVIVNWELLRRGETLWQNERIVVYQDRGRIPFSRLLGERLNWGRIFGAARAHALPVPMRVLYIVGSPVIPLVLAGRAAAKVFGSGINRGHFMASLPWLLVTASLWSLGELWGLVTMQPVPPSAGEQV